ncbi:hypothetical protein, partial [Brevundimonas sp.]|uniref:hypothetical protein n=1 Tax=Brevundimonas sp. TaxID=1871086 RepID=UPI003D6D8AEE
GLVLPQDPDDLLFRESRSFHSVRPFKGRTLAPRGGNSQGHVSNRSAVAERNSRFSQIALFLALIQPFMAATVSEPVQSAKVDQVHFRCNVSSSPSCAAIQTAQQLGFERSTSPTFRLDQSAAVVTRRT